MQVYRLTVTIPQGQAVSSVVSTEGLQLRGVAFPASMTGAKVRLEVQLPGDATWRMLRSNGNPVEIPVTPNALEVLDPNLFQEFPSLRVRSVDTTGADANQATAAQVTLVLAAD